METWDMACLGGSRVRKRQICHRSDSPPASGQQFGPGAKLGEDRTGPRAYSKSKVGDQFLQVLRAVLVLYLGFGATIMAT